MKDLKINIELKDIDLIKNLVELLQTKFSELPKEIQESLMLIEESGINDIDADKFIETYGYDVDYKNNFHSQQIISVNKILKKVCYVERDENNNILQKVEYPEHFKEWVNDKLVTEW